MVGRGVVVVTIETLLRIPQIKKAYESDVLVRAILDQARHSHWSAQDVLGLLIEALSARHADVMKELEHRFLQALPFVVVNMKKREEHRDPWFIPSPTGRTPRPPELQRLRTPKKLEDVVPILVDADYESLELRVLAAAKPTKDSKR